MTLANIVPNHDPGYNVLIIIKAVLLLSYPVLVDGFIGNLISTRPLQFAR